MISGLIDTDVLDQFLDQRPRHFREGILRDYPNGQAPLLGLTAALTSKSTVTDPNFRWFTQDYEENRPELAASIGAADTTVTVTSGASLFTANELFEIEQTGETVRVVANPINDTTLQVERGYAGSTATAVDIATDNPHFYYVGSAFEEGSRAPIGAGSRPIRYENFTQIFRNTTEITRTARLTYTRVGDTVAEQKKDVTEKHSQAIERAMFFGRPSEVLGPRPRRTTQGIVDFIRTNAPQNVFNVGDPAFGTGIGLPVPANGGGALSLAGMEEILRQVFKYGSSQKMAFVGDRAHLAIQQLIRRNHEMQFHTSEDMYGMTVNRLVTGNGELMFKTHPQFNISQSGNIGGAAPYYGKDSLMVIMDMANINYVTLNGSETMWEEDLEENDEDLMKSGWLTECGMEFHFPRTHAIIEGLVTGSAD